MKALNPYDTVVPYLFYLDLPISICSAAWALNKPVLIFLPLTIPANLHYGRKKWEGHNKNHYSTTKKFKHLGETSKTVRLELNLFTLNQKSSKP